MRYLFFFEMLIIMMFYLLPHNKIRLRYIPSTMNSLVDLLVRLEQFELLLRSMLYEIMNCGKDLTYNDDFAPGEVQWDVPPILVL